MSAVSHINAPKIPNGMELTVVEVDVERARSLPSDKLLEMTAVEFERVRHYFPIGKKLFDTVDRRIQHIRGRERRAITASDGLAKNRWDDSFTLFSPVATFSDGSGAYCATVDADMFEYYYGPDVPLVSMLISDPKSGMTINTAKPVLYDLDEQGKVVAQHFDIASLDLVLPNQPITEELSLGMGAVYLALKASY